MVTRLKGKLPADEKKQLTKMNRTVKQNLDKLNVDWSKENILTVPTDLKMPDDTEEMMNNLIKSKKKSKKKKSKKKKKHKKR